MIDILPSTPMLLAFVGASIVTLALPGPAVVYVVGRSLNQGRRAGLFSMLGLETGACVHVLAAAVGLAALLASSDAAFTATKIAGAAYLVWLAARELRTAHPGLPGGRTPADAARPLRLYLDGILVDLLNPKTALFFLAFLPQFVDPSLAAAPQFVLLGLTFVGLAAMIDGTYAVLAGRVSARLRTSQRAQRRLRTFTAGVYLALAAMAVVA